jgi:hypothetical protein
MSRRGSCVPTDSDSSSLTALTGFASSHDPPTKDANSAAATRRDLGA